MSDVQFVNREVAEAEAARAVGLLNASDESKVEAWFAMRAVADLVGIESNTGRQGISRKKRVGGGFSYGLSAQCVEGRVQTMTGSFKTEEEGLDPARLDKAEAILERKIKEFGGRVRVKRPKGTADALVEAVSATVEGKRWVEATVRPEKTLLKMVRVADEYGRDGVNPRASLSAHWCLVRFEDRKSLIQEYVSSSAAHAKAMSFGSVYKIDPTKAIKVSATQVRKLAIRTGVTESEARTLLRAFMDGRSKAKLIRAVNEASTLFQEPARRGRPPARKVGV